MVKGNIKQILILLGLSYIFLMVGNGIVSLTSPDEVFYAQSAKEMIQQKSWLVPYLFGAPQFEKPVLLFWFLRLGYSIFHNDSFAARFFPAIFATFGVIAVYFLSLLGFKNEKKAFLSSLILMSAGLYISLARTVFTDMIFSIFILLSLASFYWGYCLGAKGKPGILFFFVFSALAVLTKGPLGFFVPALIVAVFLLIEKDFKFLFSIYSLWGILLFIAISCPWYIFMIKRYGLSFTHEFFYNDHWRRLIEAEHRGNDTWYFYLVSMIGGMFPWCLYVLVSLIFLFKKLRHKPDQMHVFLVTWICATLIIFQSAHSKLASYILPLFPALAIVTADFIYESISSQKKRLFLGLSLIMINILMLAPIGFIFALLKYPNYISNKIPIYTLICVIPLFFLIALFFIIKGKLTRFTYLFSFIIPVLLLLVPFIHNDVEPYFSSKKACEYLLKNYQVENKILCTKMFVRGVRYYTNKDTAVIDIGGKNFFSPHPILFLNNDDQARDFLQKQSVTYCILKKSYVAVIERITKDRMKFSLLKIIGDEYIVKVEPLQS